MSQPHFRIFDDRRRRSAGNPVSMEALESRIFLSSASASSLHKHVDVPGPDPVPVDLTGVPAGTNVRITAELTNAADPNDIYEGEPLVIRTSGGDFVQSSYFKPQTYTFKTKVKDEKFQAYILGGDFDESATLDVSTDSLVVKADKTTYMIDAAAVMPTVKASVSRPGGGDLSNYAFEWKAKVWLPKGDAPHAIRDVAPVYFTKKTDEPTVTFSGTDWKGMTRGGRLEIYVTATSKSDAGDVENGVGDTLAIRGNNPSSPQVSGYINSASVGTFYPQSNVTFTLSQVLNKLLRSESSTQFTGSGLPVFNGFNPRKRGPDGGAGLFQITPPSDEQIWNWKKNADGGIKIFKTKYELALSLEHKLLSAVNAKLPEQLAFLNAQRAAAHKPAVTRIVIPPVSNDMRVRNAIRLYNGNNGAKDPISGTGRVQYTLANDGEGHLVLSVDEKTRVATARWIEDNSVFTTNPDYVDDVWNS